jgi:hypothetical protein
LDVKANSQSYPMNGKINSSILRYLVLQEIEEPSRLSLRFLYGLIFDNIVHIYDRNIQLLELVVSILLSKKMFNSIRNILFIARIKIWKPHRLQ